MTGIYHHKDLDGICSAAILKYKFPDIKLIGWDYGEPIPWKQIPRSEEVIMVDISFPMEDMEKLYIKTRYKLTWIDHHKTAIEDYEKYWPKADLKPLPGIREVGRAACELTWDKYCLNKSLEVPQAVKLLGSYDVWRNAGSPMWRTAVLPFQYGMRGCCNSVETFPTFLFHDTAALLAIADLITSGNNILDYLNKYYENIAKKNSFVIMFEGLRTLCVNTQGNPETVLGTQFDLLKHDAMICFSWTGEFWDHTIASPKDNVDCGEIAKRYGGGGHKGIAGFESKELILAIKP